ncbi:MAG: universal stress protein [Desulfobacteraceae bacterium]|jgi:universal stress protein A|nr:universal stress protein [Desulfobacteraceae bacterium]
MSITKLACCIDFSENSEAAFKFALELAEKYRAKLFLLHVLPPVVNPALTGSEWAVPDQPVDALITRLQEQMEKDFGSRVGSRTPYEIVVLDGHVSTEIVRYLGANALDLVVVGSYGLSGMGLVVFGSVAKRVAEKAPCSVVIVRPPQPAAAGS